jgi:hypothetical protein
MSEGIQGAGSPAIRPRLNNDGVIRAVHSASAVEDGSGKILYSYANLLAYHEVRVRPVIHG